MEDKIEMSLCFVNFVGEEANGMRQYEFCFTTNPDEFWGENFEYTPCCLINDLKPDDKYIAIIRILRTDLKLDLIQHNCCFGMQDCLDGIVALCYENISDYEEYPEEGRLFFMFGEDIDEVEKKLAAKNLLFDEKVKF